MEPAQLATHSGKKLDSSTSIDIVVAAERWGWEILLLPGESALTE